VIDDLRDVVDEVGRRDINLIQAEAAPLSQFTSVAAFIVVRAKGKFSGKRRKVSVGFSAGE
jgi:hypothetical protein